MGDPPDPGGGTEFPLQSSIDVLVDALESSMDTDCSTSEQNLLKRKRLRVKCNLCHKRKRKGGIKDAQNDCQCLITEKDVKVNYQTPQHSVLNDYNHDLNISNNTTDTSTRMPVGRSLYVKTDLSPYIIHVQKETSNANDATILHPVTFDDEVIANINVPIGSGPIIKLRRLKRKVTAGIDGTNQYVNTGTIVATFDGRTLPTGFTCVTLLFLCYKCGQGHSGSNCNVEEERYWCILCKGCHQAIDKKCLEYDRQKAIKETMSKSCISYIEALKIHPPVSRVSYADALLTSPPLPNTSRDTQNSSSSQNLPNSQNVSYKKTVFLKPKAPPKLSKGYDYHAHANIVRNPVISEHKPIHNANNNKENMQISDIIKLIIQLLSQSNIVSPSNAAAIIDTLYNISKYNNGPQSQSASVELPELNT
ncbi:hypothetical protein MSG28_009592 [Choristoneura fumiferana]|uniref:Uncharacterized protein n=1 Tax=Choristoneura fumiferana TaxID=7141 RepID=A0ACC0JBV3_CHOFU|nr:hypothetical protein MSG28_009592 [Choristoneura fumiferana]